MLSLFLLIAIAILGDASHDAVSTEDWPQFRGQNSDGHAVGGAPLHWSDTENVAWKVNVPGLGWSSPVVVGDRVFLTTAVPQGAGLSLRAMAFSTVDGKTIWDTEVFAVEQTPAIHAKNSHASPTPIVSGGHVYVHFGTLGTASLSKEDGQIQWSTQALDYPPMHGSGGSPVLHDGRLFIVCDGSTDPFVAAIRAKTGSIDWRTARSVEARISHSFVTANVVEYEGQTQVLAPGPDHFAAYDAESGKELWRVMAAGWSVVPQPVLGHGMVIYNRDYDNPELLAVKLGGQNDVTDTHVVWRIRRGAPSTPTPVLVGDELFFVSDSGVASCVDAATGQVHWTERLGGNYSASPIYVDGRILFLNETGEATWIAPGKTFQVLAKNEVQGRTFATPAFSRNAMFMRTDEHLMRIDP